MSDVVKRVRAVVEQGLLRPVEPLDLPEGRTVTVEVAVAPPGDEVTARVGTCEDALDALQQEAGRYSDEWWDEFERELREDRLHFVERVRLEDAE